MDTFDDSELNPLAGARLGMNDSCLAETQQAERICLDILVMLDSSGSMNQQPAGSPGRGRGGGSPRRRRNVL